MDLSASPPPERYLRYRWAAGIVAGGRVLDAACGAGWGTAALAEAGAQAIGVDLSPAAIADARRDHGKVAEFREADLRDLPFPDDEFDSVVCFEAITQVDDLERALAELCRVLRPRGVLLISAPNRGVYPAGNPLQLSEVTSGELEALLAARFDNVAMHCQQTYFASLLGTAKLLADDDPALNLAAEISKLSGGAPGSELYAIAVASDGELPPEPALVALGEEVDYIEQRQLLREWQLRAVEAEAKVLALERERRAAQG